MLVGYKNVSEESQLEILPIRMVISGELTFAELLATAEQSVSKAIEYSDLDLNALCQTLREDNVNFASNTLAQIVFKFVRASAKEKTSLAADNIATELLLTVVESEWLSYQFQYLSSLYDESTIKRLGDNYQQLLKSIIANSNVELDRLPLISTAEAERVLYTWNQTRVEFESSASQFCNK